MAINHSSVLIFGDQLNSAISSLKSSGAENIVMIESTRKCSSKRWHKRRIALIISSMRHFRDELRSEGYDVDYYEWDCCFTSALKKHVADKKIKTLFVMKPKNRDGIKFIESLDERLGIEVKITANSLFICPEDDFKKWAAGKKRPLMESFYRMMRRKNNVLMDGDKPAGGAWNFDKENRKPPPHKEKFPGNMALEDDNITNKVIADVNTKFPENFGELKSINYPVDRKRALKWLDMFINEKLAKFGPYEDAMLSSENVLFHSRASALMNIGLILPEESVRAAEKAYYDGIAPINSAEGYIRQILGWREYMAGMYSILPDILTFNYFKNTGALPSFYWDESLAGMNCLHNAIRSVRETGYTHHIIRLMVLGNFALISGVVPGEVSDWFLEAYEDAFEWVVAPNVICMSQYADGGILATKPYASSASYINKMSDHCKSCKYSPENRVQKNTCPFNFLYRDFLIRNKKLLSGSNRMALAYRSLEATDPKTIEAYKKMAEDFLKFERRGRDLNP